MWRFLRNLFLVLIGLVILALASLATPVGHWLVAGIIERSASRDGLTVSIEGVSGWPPFWTGARTVTLADANGVFAEIRDLDVDLNVLPLLTGALSIRSLDAAEVTVARRPTLPGGGGGDGALLPFAAERFSIARLNLADGVAGAAAALAVNGTAHVGRDGSVAAAFAADRIDGGTGTLSASFDRASAALPLGIDINLREGDDGIIPALLGRPQAPAYALGAKTGLDGDVFSGSLALNSSGSARFDGRFSLAPAGDQGHRLTLNGSGDLAELVPPEYATLLAGPISIDIDADWQSFAGEALPQFTIHRGAVSTAALNATASGTYSAIVADLKLALRAASADGAPLDIPFAGGARIDSADLSGTVAPSGNTIRLDLVGRVAGLDVADTRIPGLGISLAVETAAGNPLGGGKLPFALRAEADAIEGPAGRVEAIAGAPIILTADGTFDTATARADTTANLAISGGTLAFTGTAAAAGLEGRLSADFANIASLSPLVGRTVAGALDATADGTFSAAASNFTIAGTAVDLNPGDATLARLLAGVTGFSATVAQQGDRLALTDAKINGISVTATGGVTLSPEAIDASVDGTISDLSLLAEQSSGAASFTARITGAPTRPDVDATIAVPSGSLAGQRIESATANFKGAPTGTGWQGALNLSGSLDGGPLTGTADVTLDQANGLLAFPRVDLQIGSNRIAGAIERTGEGPLSGTLTVDAPDLGSLSALALTSASGSGRADVRFAPDGQRQSVAVSFTGNNVRYGDATAGAVRGEAVIDDAFGTPQVRGNATASALRVGGVVLDTLQATATVEGGATLFNATARGPDINLAGRGSLSESSGAPVLRLDALDGTAFRFPVALNQPVTLRLDENGSRLSGATLALGGGTIRIDGTVFPRLDLTVVVSNVSASVADGFSPGLGAQGTVSGRATVTGSPASPAIAWTATWSAMRTVSTTAAGLPPLSLSASGNATRTATSVNANLSGGGLALTITGQVPFTGAGLNLRAQGDAPLALFAAQSTRELRLAGTARVNLAVTGSLASPAISGTIDVVNGVYADVSSGFSVVDANGRIALNGQTATVQSLNGRMGQGGQIVVGGTVSLAGTGLPAAVTIRISNGRFSDGATVNTTFNADLAVNGPLLGGGVISGRVDLGRTEIQLPERVGTATAIDVQHINKPPGFIPPEPRLRPGSNPTAASSGSGGLGLDVTLSANSSVFVRGFGIDAEFGGSLRMGGTTASPQAVGGLQMRWGRIEVLGRRFDFNNGTLTFAGDFMPLLDFSATTTTPDATVTLSVVGPANDPEIHFSSSPSMPEEEIISRLLFQRSVGSLSAFQALQLVDAVAQLTGAVGQGGIVGRIRQATGLDDLDIRQTATGGTTIGIGRRINENLRLGVETGTQAGSGRVVIDLDITPNLKGQVQAGQDGHGSVGLTYEREY